MLSRFDWLRRCRSGGELLATLKYFSEHPDTDLSPSKQGAPFSAIGGLCHRCKVYATVAENKKHHRYCEFCEQIFRLGKETAPKSYHSIVIWGYVTQISRRLRESKPSGDVHGVYIHDENHFLAMINRWYLRQWLQELVIYSGLSLKGLLQIFSSLEERDPLSIGDYLTWAVHHEASLSLDQLRVRFYTQPQQLFNPKRREKEGLLTYHVADFINMLETVEVFRANLHPQEQKDLYELLSLKDPKEEQFYWGRFLGQLSQEAKDMLAAWKIRQWSKSQTEFFFHLIKYVILPQSH